jgi:hypothetical protein
MRFKNYQVKYKINSLLFIDTIKDTTKKTIIYILAQNHQCSTSIITILELKEI